MFWSEYWRRLTLVGTSQATSIEDRDQIILLNKFVVFSILPLFTSFVLYSYLENWLMLNITLVGVFIYFLALSSIRIFGKEKGWHIALIASISFLIAQALLFKFIFSIIILLSSFVILVNYIYLKSKIRFFYYSFLTVAILIVLINPSLPLSVTLEDAYVVNLIYGVAGIFTQILFSVLLARQAKKKDQELLENEVRINQLLSELKEKNSSLELEVTKRTGCLEKLNNELKRSNLDLNQFAFAASHDLKEPLRTIASFLKILSRRNIDQIDDQGIEYLNFAIDGAMRMSSLIDDILDYSQVKTDAPKTVECRLTDIVERKLLDLNPKIKEKNALLVYNNLPDNLKCVPNQIGMLVYNLINNALKFNTSDRPTIVVKGKERESDWLISVSDNGIGIDEKDKEKIFDAFHRLHSKQDYEGSGIGLAICKKIVNRHQGEIWLESSKNKGTTFFFTVRKSMGVNQSGEECETISKKESIGQKKTFRAKEKGLVHKINSKF